MLKIFLSHVSFITLKRAVLKVLILSAVFIAFIICLSEHCFSNTVDIGVDISSYVAGNGSGSYGTEPFSLNPNYNNITLEAGFTAKDVSGSRIDGSFTSIGYTANYNTVVIKGTATSTVDGVFIGTNPYTFGGFASFNSVNVEGVVSGVVSGARIWGYGQTERNSINILGVAENSVYGASIASSGTAKSNLITISGQTENRDIIGAKIFEMGEAVNNGVTVSTGGVLNYSYGNTDLGVHGAYIGYGSVMNNFVKIYGTVNNSDAYGARAGTGTAINNFVSVFETGIISGTVYGAKIGTGTATNNRADISGIVKNDVFGSWIDSGTASYNILNIAGEVDKDVTASHVGNGIATNNIVNISGLVGDDVRGVFITSGTALGNSVEVSGKVIRHVFGVEVSAYGNASSNTVNILGTVGENVYGSWIRQGVAYNNTVIINSGANIGGNITGGFASDNGNNNITNNTIIVYEGAILSPAGVLWGGRTKAGDAFSGNTLKMYAKSIQVYGINNFEFYNFYFPNDIKDGDIIITAVAGTGGSRSGGTDTNSAIDLGRSRVNIQFQDYIPILNQRDKFYLLVSSGTGTGISNKPVNDTVDDIKGMYGVTVLYDYSFNLSTTETSLILEVEDAKFDLNPQAKSYLEDRVSEMIFINRGLDLIAEKGIREANESVNSKHIDSLDSYGRAGAFGVMTDVNLRYSGDLVEVKGITFIAGMAKEYRPADKKLVLGCFLEHGEGEYTIKVSYNKNTILGNLSGQTEAKGKPQYMGIGILGRFGLWNVKDDVGKIINEIYLEGSAKIGKTDSSYSNKDIETEAKFDTDGTYYGGHIGCGYIKYFGILDLEGYFKWLCVRQESKEAKLVTKDTIDFGKLTSSRLRVGARSSFKLLRFIMPFIEIGAEYEMEGKVTAKTFVFEIEPEDLGGWSQTGEFGIKIEFGNFRMELSGESYVGKREGLVGLLRLAYLL
ncbi:MAG: hypothetical protein LBQ04_00445 [Endomicrobium sp.]|nr:hypothetical protein [Endomicrobium sp.]